MGILPFSCEIIPLLSGLHNNVKSREVVAWFYHQVPDLPVLDPGSGCGSEPPSTGTSPWEHPGLVPSPALSSPRLCWTFPWLYPMDTWA